MKLFDKIKKHPKCHCGGERWWVHPILSEEIADQGLCVKCKEVGCEGGCEFSFYEEKADHIHRWKLSFEGQCGDILSKYFKCDEGGCTWNRIKKVKDSSSGNKYMDAYEIAIAQRNA